MKRFLALAALCCTVLAGCESTTAPKEKSHFDIFAYYSILSELATPENFQRMADAGITISYMSYGSIEENLKVLDAAKETNVKICVGLDNWFYSPIDARLDTLIMAVKDHPALWGYMIVDEPSAQWFHKVKEVREYVSRIDSTHKFYVNLFPEIGTQADCEDDTVAAMKALGTSNYLDYLHRYIKEAEPDYISFDIYPLLHENYHIKWQWGRQMRNIAEVCKEADLPFWAFAASSIFLLQSYPSTAAIKLQHYTNLAHGAQVLEYYTYQAEPEPGNDGPLRRDGSYTEMYDFLKEANAELNNRAYIFLGDDVKWFRYTGDEAPIGCDDLMFSEDILPEQVAHLGTDIQALISYFTNAGHSYLMVVSHTMESATNVELDFNKKVLLSKTDGSWEKVAKGHQNYTVAPGDCLIFRLD